MVAQAAVAVLSRMIAEILRCIKYYDVETVVTACVCRRFLRFASTLYCNVQNSSRTFLSSLFAWIFRYCNKYTCDYI